MKKSKFPEAEILAAFKRVEEGQSVTALCRELKITRAAFYKWRTKYGWVKQNAESNGKAASLTALLKELKAEEIKLKQPQEQEGIKQSF